MTRVRISLAQPPWHQLILGAGFLLVALLGGSYVVYLIQSPGQVMMAVISVPLIVLFAGIGAALVRSGLRARKNFNRLRRSGIRCEGVVTGVVQSAIAVADSSTYIVQYEYKDRPGHMYRGESPRLFPLDAARWQPADRVAILYDRFEPSTSEWCGERWERPSEARQPPRPAGTSAGDRFDYGIAGKAMVLAGPLVGAAFVALSFVIGEGPSWLFALMGSLGIVAPFSYPVGIEIGERFIRVHYLFGWRRTFGREELEFDLYSTTLMGRRRGATGLRRLLGSFHFVLHVVSDGDELLRQLGFEK